MLRLSPCDLELPLPALRCRSITEKEMQMSLKTDSKLETELSPEEVSDDQSLTKDEKLARISDMKYDLERQTGRGTADLDQVETRMAAINLAMSRAKHG